MAHWTLTPFPESSAPVVPTSPARAAGDHNLCLLPTLQRPTGAGQGLPSGSSHRLAALPPSHRLAAPRSSRGQALPPCVLIPGWSVGSDIFARVLPELSQHFGVWQADLTVLESGDTIETVVAELARALTDPAWLIGWSLGGNIALELAARYPEKVLGLCLLGTSPSFVRRGHWPAGMDPQVLVQFQEGMETHPEKTLKRFDALQVRGDQQEKDLKKFLRDYRRRQGLADQALLARGLALLAEFDQVEKLQTLSMPTLWYFGDQDRLVDAAVAADVQRCLPAARTCILEQTAHLPFLTQPDQFLQGLLGVAQQVLRREKRQVAAAFGRAADGYDASARLQHEVADQLLQRVVPGPGILLDAGCGTAAATARLAERADHVIAVDLAAAMLRYGREKYPQLQSWLVADLEHLPLAAASVEGIFSSLAVQWCTAVAGFLDGWYRVLKPGGKVYVATLGPQTLCELRASFAMATSYRHVNQFVSADMLTQQAQRAGYSLLECQVENKVMRYAQLRELLRDLKNIGAQTVLGGRMPGLMGPARFRKIEQAYAAYRDRGGFLPVTYEVIFLCLQKPLQERLGVLP